MTMPIPKRSIAILGVCIAIGLFENNAIQAQSKNQFGSVSRRKPSVSPYLSTLDNGSGYGALNYYNIVKPQQRARQAGREFQKELHSVENNLSSLERTSETPVNTAPITTGRMPPTGHAVSFGDTGGYFGGGAGGGPNQFGRNRKRTPQQ